MHTSDWKSHDQWYRRNAKKNKLKVMSSRKKIARSKGFEGLSTFLTPVGHGVLSQFLLKACCANKGYSCNSDLIDPTFAAAAFQKNSSDPRLIETIKGQRLRGVAKQLLPTKVSLERNSPTHSCGFYTKKNTSKMASWFIRMFFLLRIVS